MSHIISALAHGLGDLARWLAIDFLPSLMVQIGQTWMKGYAGGG